MIANYTRSLDNAPSISPHRETSKVQNSCIIVLPQLELFLQQFQTVLPRIVLNFCWLKKSTLNSRYNKLARQATFVCYIK